MSSIYRKGRDGYYYYQTYVYNPESKKKDKRIFHSLSTRNQVETETKQNELDTQYEKQNYIDSKSSRLSYNFTPKPTIAIIVGTIAITILLVDYFRPDTGKQNPSGPIITAKAVAMATIHKGTSAGIVSGISIPETKNPS